MFTGIVETTGIIKEVISNGSNKSFWVGSVISPELSIDQSVCHDGTCLTIEETRDKNHRITAIEETLKKTSLDVWEPGTVVNLERCLRVGDRLDGHIVQGHVDTTGTCLLRKEKNGSWEFQFSFPGKFSPLVIEKGSICVNGISLTAFDVKKKRFSVAVIPYTFEHTNIKEVLEGGIVNLEFDIIGKYLVRSLSLKKTD
jgi:riboflavin synthase